MSQQNLL